MNNYLFEIEHTLKKRTLFRWFKGNSYIEAQSRCRDWCFDFGYRLVRYRGRKS